MDRDPNQPTVGPDGKPLEEQPQWRRDFPIDVPRDNLVARRDFVRFLVLTSGAFAAGQIWIGVNELRARRRERPSAKRLVAVDEMPIGGVLSFSYAGIACLLARLDERKFVAYSQMCTHLSCAVQPRLDVGKLHCPCHNGWFDVQDGRPLAGPPRRPLSRILLEVRDGVIYATGVEDRT